MTRPTPPAPDGTVYLVGAGPGSPELLTVRARRLLEAADVVLYDSLVRRELVDACVSPAAETIDVGKRPGSGRRWRQAEIHRCLAEKAAACSTVVRLKGGDPTVFGRGGEEAAFLAERNIPFEVVPGVSSAVAAPALAGIPVTHRAHASSLTVVTGHEDPTKEESALDWGAIADSVAAGGTLVILMGVGRLAENASALVDGGLPEETPVAMVEKATWPDERVLTGTLGTIVERARRAAITSPAVVVVGEVVSVRWAARDDRASASRRGGRAGSPSARPADARAIPVGGSGVVDRPTSVRDGGYAASSPHPPRR